MSSPSFIPLSSYHPEPFTTITCQWASGGPYLLYLPDGVTFAVTRKGWARVTVKDAREVYGNPPREAKEYEVSHGFTFECSTLKGTTRSMGNGAAWRRVAKSLKEIYDYLCSTDL